MQLPQILEDRAITEEMLRGAREIVRLQQESGLHARLDSTSARDTRVPAGQHRHRYAAGSRTTGQYSRSRD
ncbi:MAG: hypothetical protein AAGI72_05155 [Pseudomonadota bacterium]